MSRSAKRNPKSRKGGAVKIYHPTEGEREIAVIDFTEAWKQRGWSSEPVSAGVAPAPAPEPAPASPAVSPALALINSAQEVDDLIPLPGIGKGAAKIILEQRPDGGYRSLGDLPDRIMKSPYNVTMDGVEGWEGSA